MVLQTVEQSSEDLWTYSVDKSKLLKPQVEHDRFLVSFLVDARGGSMRGSRHPGLRLLVPPSATSAPTRVTCRMLRPERTPAPPQLSDGEGLACRIIELGPFPCKFNSPVLLEIPHFASLRGRQREIVVLRSDDAESWKEHSLEATDQTVRNVLGSSFDSLETVDQLREKRIIRVLLSDFPQYLAVVSRLRQEIAMIGSDGGVLSSTIEPQIQAIFPEGALQKRIRVGLQAHQLPAEMVIRTVGSQVTVSPIVTIEPRRRKFHKPITLTMPLPKSAKSGKNVISHGDANSASRLRLMCSITGGTTSALWEDITGSTPLSRVKDCVSFTTTVSARFWLIDCSTAEVSSNLAMNLYKEASSVPYMGKFIVFVKRPEVDEALIRCFCITDDKIDKTLECQEGFDLVAASSEVEIIDNQSTWLETSGNLKPVFKMGEKLRLHFNAFRENRLAFPVRIQDIQLEPSARVAFVRNSMSVSENAHDMIDTQPTLVMCGLDIMLPTELDVHRHHRLSADRITPTEDGASTVATASVASLSCSQPQKFEHAIQNGPDYDSHGRSLTVPPINWVAALDEDAIARSQLDLVEVANAIGSDWPKLVVTLFTPNSSELPPSPENLIDWITRHCSSAETLAISGLTHDELKTDRDRALAILIAWTSEFGNLATGNELDNVLRQIGREDVIKNCMRDIQPVLENDEKQQADRIITGQRDSSPISGTASTLGSSDAFHTDKLLSGQLETSDNVVNQQALEVRQFEDLVNNIPSSETTLEPLSLEQPTESFVPMEQTRPHLLEGVLIQNELEHSEIVSSEDIQHSPEQFATYEDQQQEHLAPETFNLMSSISMPEQKAAKLVSEEPSECVTTQQDLSELEELEGLNIVNQSLVDAIEMVKDKGDLIHNDEITDDLIENNSSKDD